MSESDFMGWLHTVMWAFFMGGISTILTVLTITSVDNLLGGDVGRFFYLYSILADHLRPASRYATVVVELLGIKRVGE